VNPSSAEARSQPREETKPRLCVVLACHRTVCALPIDNIDRLVLPEAVEAVEAPRPAATSGRGPGGSTDAAAPGVVRIDGKSYAAWDLGVLFGLGPVQGAWVLLSLMHEGTDLALALRTGPCFAVQSLRNLLKIPGEVFQERRGALTDAFATSAIKRTDLETNVGVLIDPRGLWSRAELQMSAAVLDASNGQKP
jgi:hypothetical protein